MGNYPKIGIRPTIDGRMNGVRESLEDQTMNMARQVAGLIGANLRYPDGSPVQCVISDTTIGRVAESAACAGKFARENVAVTITVTPCWCYGSETMDMDPHTIKAVWGFNGTERPGAVYLAAVLAAQLLRQDVRQLLPDVLAAADAPGLHVGPKLIHGADGQVHPQIGGDQGLLQLVEKFVVGPGEAVKEAGDVLPRLAEPVFDLLENTHIISLRFSRPPPAPR